MQKYALIKALKDNNYINVDEKSYGRITVLNNNLDDNDYTVLYSSIKL